MTFANLLSGTGRTAALAVAILLGSAALASAATLKLSTTFDVGRGQVLPNTFPSDPGGLDGSTFTIETVFAEGSTFQGGFVTAAGTTAMISGASGPTSNGTFDVTGEVGLFQSSGFGGLGQVARSFVVFQNGFAAGDFIQSLKLDAGGTVGERTDGTALTLDILQGVSFRGLGGGSASIFSGFANSNFTIDNIRTTASVVPDIAPVPLPAALPLMLAGLGGLGGLSAIRRRRRLAV